MEIKININHDDYEIFARKALELGINPVDTIFNIISKRLGDSNLRSEIVSEDNKTTYNESEVIFLNFENKMKKYNIHQSSIAAHLGTTQASVSRALKSKKDNSLLYKKIAQEEEKLLVYAYINQNAYILDYSKANCKKPVPETAHNFFNCVAGLVKANISFRFSEDMFLKLICNFVKSDIFQGLEFEKLYNDIELFVDTVNEIVSNYFYEREYLR